MSQNTQTLASTETATLPSVDVEKANVVANYEAAKAASKLARDAYVKSLDVASAEDVASIVAAIKSGERATNSLPKIVSVLTEDSEGEIEVERRIDEGTPAYEAVEVAFNARQKHLKSKGGRAKVDEAIAKLTCTSFTMRTKQQKDGSMKAKASVVFEG